MTKCPPNPHYLGTGWDQQQVYADYNKPHKEQSQIHEVMTPSRKTYLRVPRNRGRTCKPEKNLTHNKTNSHTRFGIVTVVWNSFSGADGTDSDRRIQLARRR